MVLYYMRSSIICFCLSVLSFYISDYVIGYYWSFFIFTAV